MQAVPDYIIKSLIKKTDDPEHKAVLGQSLKVSHTHRKERRLITNDPGKCELWTASMDNKTDPLPGNAYLHDDEILATPDDAMKECHEGMRIVKEFFQSRFGRNSLDGNGMDLIGAVHYGVQYTNAFWNGKYMVFGDGDGVYFNRFTRSRSVIFHEFVHGFTQFTADLPYEFQLGAMNEHISDALAIIIMHWADKVSAEEGSYLIGGDGLVTDEFPGPAIRTCENKKAYDDEKMTDPQPKHMDDFVYTWRDSRGVHINSGILNRLLMEFAKLVGGKIYDEVADIWFHSVLALPRVHPFPFTPFAFNDFRDTTLRICRERQPRLESKLIEAHKIVGLIK